MVRQRLYALEEASSGVDIDQTRPWEASVRRGMKIDMSMVFSGAESINQRCPGCGTEAAAPENKNVIW